MPRQAFKNTVSLSERAAAKARELREKATLLQAGPDRDRLLRQANEHESVAQLDGYLRSADLKKPV